MLFFEVKWHLRTPLILVIWFCINYLLLHICIFSLRLKINTDTFKVRASDGLWAVHPCALCRRCLSQWWKICRSVKDSTRQVICCTSFQVCLEFVDAFKCVCCLCLYVLRDWQSAHMRARYLRVSQQPHLLLGVTHFPCSTSFSSLVDPRGSKKPVVYVHFISQQQSSEGDLDRYPSREQHIIFSCQAFC